MGTPDGATTAGLLLALMRARLGTGPLPDRAALDGCDWDWLERLAAHHGLSAPLHRTIEDRGLEAPPQLRRRLRFAYYGNHLRNVCVVRLRDEITAGLASHGIPVTLIKGASLLRTIYAAEPALRRLTDIDLLVDEPDVEPAEVQLRRLGFSRMISREEARRGPASHFHRVYQREDSRSIPLELHWRLFEPHQAYLFDLREARAAALPASDAADSVRILAPEHELAHLCSHLARHAVVFGSLIDHPQWRTHLVLQEGAARLIWLFDIAVYLQRRSPLISWQRLLECCERWSLSDRIRPVFELCSQAFGVAPPDGVLGEMKGHGPRSAERLASRLLLRPRSAAEPVRAPAGRVLSPELIVRILYTWEWVFPPRRYLTARYARRASVVGAWLVHARQVLPELCREVAHRVWQRARAGAPPTPRPASSSGPRGHSLSLRGPALRGELASCAIGEDWIVYDPVADRATVLNPTAAAIAAACDGRRTFAEIAEYLSEAALDPPADLEREIRRVAGELAGAGLLLSDRLTGL